MTDERVHPHTLSTDGLVDLRSQFEPPSINWTCFVYDSIVSLCVPVRQGLENPHGGQAMAWFKT